MMSNSTLHTFFYSTLALAALLAVLTALPTLRMNQWSLTFWRFNTNGGSLFALNQPDVTHRRAATWLVEDAIRVRDVARAQASAVQLAGDTDPFARRALGRLYSLQGEPEQAIEVWTAAGDYRSLITMATGLEEQGRDGQAYDVLRAANTVAPETGVTAVANFLIDHDAPAEAARMLQQAIDEHPYSYHRRTWLSAQGRIWRDQEAWAKALATAQQLMVIDPVYANLELGRLVYKRGDGVEAALAYFEQAASSDPSQGDAYYQGARLLQRERRFEEADLWYLAAVAVEPDKASWMRAFANNARVAGDLDAAIERFEEATRRFPDDARSHAQLAWAYHLAGESQAAIQRMDLALKLMERTSAGDYVRAATIYEAAGEAVQAAEHFAAALTIDPENSRAQAGMKRIEAGR